MKTFLQLREAMSDEEIAKARKQSEELAKKKPRSAAEVAKEMMRQYAPKKQEPERRQPSESEKQANRDRAKNPHSAAYDTQNVKIKYKNKAELDAAQKRNQKAAKKKAKKEAKKAVKKQLLDIKQSNSDAYVRNSYKNTNEGYMFKKTFEQFAEEVDISRLSPEKQEAARKKAAADGIPIKGDKKRDDERKRLPGSRGGALVPTRKAAADKGGAIVKAKKGALQAPDKVEKAKVKVHNQPQRPGTTRPTKPEGKKGGMSFKWTQNDPKDKEKKDKKDKPNKFAEFIKNNIKGDGKPLGNAEGDVKGPQMGIYNPK